jgi:prolipoprotein diacylglyceryltransferase
MLPLVFGVRLYPIVVGAFVALGVAVTCRQLLRRGLSARSVLVFQLALVAFALGGARLYAMTEAGVLPPWLSSSALRYPGGMALVCVTFPVARRLARIRLPLGALADAVVPGVVVALVGIRLGCLLHGCCYGTASDLPWAIAFPVKSPAWSEQVKTGALMAEAPSAAPVHPLQLYFALWALVAWGLAGRARAVGDGSYFLAFLAIHDAGKAALESLRAPQPVWHLQLGSLLIAGAAVALLGLAHRRRLLAGRRSPAVSW